jgi:hypothetical protein
MTTHLKTRAINPAAYRNQIIPGEGKCKIVIIPGRLPFHFHQIPGKQN